MINKEQKQQRAQLLRKNKTEYKHAKKEKKLEFSRRKNDEKYQIRTAKFLSQPQRTQQKQQAKQRIREARRLFRAQKYQLKCAFLDQKSDIKKKYTVLKGQLDTKRPPSSLSFSVSVAYMTVFAALMAMQITFVLVAYRFSFDHQAKKELTTIADALAGRVEADAGKMINETVPCIAVYDQSGELIFSVGDTEKKFVSHPKMRSLREDSTKLRLGAQQYMLVSRDVMQNGVSARLTLVYDMQQQETFYALLVNLLLISAAGGLAVAGFVGYRVTKKQLRPIYSMTRVMKEINASDLSQRIDTEKIRTELRQSAETFNEMMDKLQQAYEQQRQFISDASHELRTPLAVISGYADILARWGQNEPAVREEAIDSIHQQCTHMKILLERLLVIARNENGATAVHTEAVKIFDIVEQVVADFSLMKENRKITIEINREQQLVCDPEQLQQILIILLNNAVKFTDEATGEIHVFISEDADGTALCVQDNGIGIAPEIQKKIFERFYKADRARSDKSGYGLGLSIAKQSAAMMNATLSVQSMPGEGSTFRLVFPPQKN